MAQQAQVLIRKFVFSKFSPYVILLSLLLNFGAAAINIFKAPQYSQEFVNALQDSVKVVKNKNNELEFRTLTLTSQNVNSLLAIKQNNETIKKLQEEVKQYKNRLGKTGSVVVANNVTHLDSTLVATPDSLYFKDKWVDLVVKNTNFKLSVINKPTIVLGEDKQGKFVSIHDENPYVVTKDVRSYQKEEKKSVFTTIWDAKGYIAAGILGGFIFGSK